MVPLVDPVDPTACPYCLQCPCITRHPLSWLRGAAAPSVTNHTKRYNLYRKFWKALKDLGLWSNPTYLLRKSLRTTPYDPREMMPNCVVEVKCNIMCYSQYCHSRKFEGAIRTLMACHIKIMFLHNSKNLSLH
jgi:hypothetical protein